MQSDPANLIVSYLVSHDTVKSIKELKVWSRSLGTTARTQVLTTHQKKLGQSLWIA
jgi:hypothetical protein